MGDYDAATLPKTMRPLEQLRAVQLTHFTKRHNVIKASKIEDIDLETLQCHLDKLKQCKRNYQTIVNAMFACEDANIEAISERQETFYDSIDAVLMSLNREIRVKAAAEAEEVRVKAAAEAEKARTKESEAVALKELNSVYDELYFIENEISQIGGFIANFEKEPIGLTGLKGLRQEAETISQRYKTVMLLAKSITAEEDEDTLNSRHVNFKMHVMKNIELIQQEIQKLDPGVPTSASNEAKTTNRSAPRTKLPPLDIGEFDGSIDKWVPFRDSFKSLIHDNTELAGNIKFRYLQNAITHSLSPISKLPPTDDGYEEAWNLVNKKYTNEREIVGSHFTAIMKLKKMTDDSPDDLEKLINDVQVHTAALKRICGQDKLFEALIAHMTMFRLDKTTREKVEEEVQDKIPIWSDVCKVLEKRAKILSAMPKGKPAQSKPVIQQSQSFTKPTVFKMNSLNASKSSQETAATAKPAYNAKLAKCYVCNGSHKCYQCPDFIQMNSAQRLKIVREKKLCENCLGNNCQSQCLSRSNCRTCAQRHSSLLHDAFPKMPAGRNETQVQFNKNDVSTVRHESQRPFFSTAAPFRTNANCSTISEERRTFLSTAMVKVHDANGTLHELRALLDCGSEENFITKSAANALGLKQERVSVETIGFGQQTTIVDRATSIKIQFDNGECIDMSCLVSKKVTGNVPVTFTSKELCEIPMDLKLSDPNFNVPGKVDLLIGNTYYWDLMKQQVLKLKSGITLVETRLGWMIAGSLKEKPRITRQCNLATIGDIDNTLKKFYNLEDYQSNKTFLTDEERFCEETFEQTHQRAADGRFIIAIPMKENVIQLADNRAQAYSQFLSNEKRLQKNETLRFETNKFMKEYLDLGHMEEVTDEEDQKPGFYLPHHAVEKPDSTSTKVRIVFNGSAKTKSGLSFNDVQCIGPKIQPDSFELTLKFRQYVIFVKADIAKMYRQIEVVSDQRNYQKIFYRANPEDKLKAYRLKTVTYGTSSASYQSQRCLKQLAIESANDFPKASKEIEQGFYVDDLITGSDNVPEAIKLYNEIDAIVSSAQMKLRKISSNSEEFLKSYPKEDLEFADDRNQLIGVLGMKYNPVTDSIHFEMKEIVVPKVISKRHILSEIASITDPDGILGPVVFEFKKFMKTVHMCKLPWDAPVDEREQTKWLELANSIMDINKVTVPRLITLSTYVSLQLHGFSDASEEGFGAVFYARSEDSNGLVAVRLITAKSRVSPAEKRSIPRLELCGAVVMTDLREKLNAALSINFEKTFFWMDSAIAIHWISKSPTQLQTFVANRVSHIQEFTKDVKWQHVRGDENPADLISRGLMPSEIVDNSFWFNGPEFLKNTEESWPTSIVTINAEEPLYKNEFKKINAFPAQQPLENGIIAIVEKSSCLEKARRKIALISRFLFNIRANISKTSKRTGSMVPTELKEAELLIAAVYQREYFPEECKSLKEGHQVEKGSSIKNLAPFWDSKSDVIRVGGRLGHAEHCPIDLQHQVLIPQSHLSTLIVRRAHIENMHCGQQATLGHIRQQYWPIRIKNTIKKELHKCITCFRVRPTLVEQFMGQLPAPRVTAAPPFHHTGVDYAGPFNVKVSAIRNARAVKCYTAVFICLATKAIHIEVVSDLTTKAFLAALDRLFSRRGLSAHIYSDNGTQFHGADNELKQLYAFMQSPQVQHEIVTSLRDKEVTWHFNAPKAPEHGGLWEAAVKSMKHHMHRVCKDALLTFEEFGTLATKIEAILNSRPLTAISNDPNDMQTLTAGHFLIGRPLNALPQADQPSVPIHHLQRWDRVQRMQQHFWKRWSQEYLHQLQVRTKRYKERTDIKEGQMVMMHIDNQPALQWPIARIIAIHPGKDGVTRVATVKTSKGIYQRPVNKLALLPIDLEPSPAAGC